jgi:hypothetical protein
VRTIYILEPNGWPCTFGACPPGFFMRKGNLYLKSEYFTEGRPDAYCDTGEYFAGGVQTPEERLALIVQPVTLMEREVSA